MFVHIHIPIIDCRSLCSSFQRLKRPVFPIPEENDFIRNFGKVSLNYIPALPCYAGEDWFFRGENTVRFKELPRFRIRIGKQYYNCQSKFRRLFCNGKMANRYEVGLEFTGMRVYANQLVDHLFSLGVKVKNCEKGYTPTTLLAVGKFLPAIYDYSTSNQPLHDDLRVSCGETLCILESAAGEIVFRPQHAELVLKFPKQGLSLYHFVYTRANTKIHCWIIQKWLTADARFASKLRNALFQVHLESQSLIQAYKFLILNDDPQKLNKEAFLRFVTDIQAKLKRRSRFTISTERIVNIALKATHALQPAQMTKMIDMVDRIGDKYQTADFLELMSPLTIAEWKEEIERELQKNWSPGTKTQLEYLKEACCSSSFKQFIRFIVQYKGEIWDIAKDIITDRLKK